MGLFDIFKGKQQPKSKDIISAIFLEVNAVAVRAGFWNKRVNEFIFSGSVQSWMPLLVMRFIVII